MPEILYDSFRPEAFTLDNIFFYFCTFRVHLLNLYLENRSLFNTDSTMHISSSNLLHCQIKCKISGTCAHN